VHYKTGFKVFSPKSCKKLAQIRIVIFQKKLKKTHTLISKNDVTDPKIRLL